MVIVEVTFCSNNDSCYICYDKQWQTQGMTLESLMETLDLWAYGGSMDIALGQTGSEWSVTEWSRLYFRIRTISVDSFIPQTVPLCPGDKGMMSSVGTMLYSTSKSREMLMFVCLQNMPNNTMVLQHSSVFILSAISSY